MARLAALSLAVAAWWPASAEAADVGGAVGPYVSFTFGDTVGIGYGLDALMVVAPGSAGSTCSDGLGDHDYGFGPAFQIGGINAEKLRIVVALVGGGTVADEDTVAVLGEAGLAVHTDGKQGSFGIHTGAQIMSPHFMFGFARAEWLLDEYSLGAGARYPNVFHKEASCDIGRPLRDAGGSVVARVPPRVSPLHRPQPLPSCEDASAIARAWADDAQGEAASVPAFLQLAADLMAHDAPDELVDAALDAAEDEVRHAHLCARLASRLAGRRIHPAVPRTSIRPPLAGVDGLHRIAAESWIDGCLSEGAAARRAARAAREATDPQATATQVRIARDEAAHAELGWRVLAWAMDRGGDEVTERVLSLRDAPSPDAGPAVDLPPDAVAYGRLPRALAETEHARHALAARRRLTAVAATRRRGSGRPARGRDRR